MFFKTVISMKLIYIFSKLQFRFWGHRYS